MISGAEGVKQAEPFRFIVDNNVGKLVRWLRLMGYDTLFFTGADDGDMVAAGLAEGRVVLTRDTGIARRRVATSGRLRTIVFRTDDPGQQLRQLITALDLNIRYRPFTVCLECNRPLEARRREEVEGRVPPYVFQTRRQYMECPACGRIYWRGTHWRAMTAWLDTLAGG